MGEDRGEDGREESREKAEAGEEEQNAQVVISRSTIYRETQDSSFTQQDTESVALLSLSVLPIVPSLTSESLSMSLARVFQLGASLRV